MSTHTTSSCEGERTYNVARYHLESEDSLLTNATPHIVTSTAAATIGSITRSSTERYTTLEKARGRESRDSLSARERFDIGSSSERDTVANAHGSSADIRPTLGNLATSNSLKQSSSQHSSLEHSPSTKTLEKLRSFKFIKPKPVNTHPLKRPTTSDSQLDLTPPPNKRRPVCNDVTNCEPITCKNDTSSHDNAPIDQDRSAFKKPSFIPKTHLNSSMAFVSSSKVNSQISMNSFSSPLNSHQGQSSAQVKSTINTRGMFSNEVATSSATHTGSQPNCPLPWTRTPTAPQHTQTSLSQTVTDAQPRFGTPSVVSRSCSGVAPSTPLSTVTSSQPQTRLSTSQVSEHECMMRTPTRGRQTTPLVCTPAGSVATPTSRTSVPIRRKFPGPAGLLPSLVCVCIPQGSPHTCSWWAWLGGVSDHIN